MAERRKSSLPSQIGPSGNRIPSGGEFNPQQMLNQQFGYTTKLQAPPGLHGPFMVSYGQQGVFPQQGPYPHHASSYQQQHPQQQQQQQQFQQQQQHMQFMQQHDNVHSMQFMQDTQKSSSSQSQPNIKLPEQEVKDGESSSSRSSTGIVKQDNSNNDGPTKEESEAAAAKKELEAIRAAHEKQVRELEERIKALEEQKSQKEVKYLRVPAGTQKKSQQKRPLETEEEDAGNNFDGIGDEDVLDRCPSPTMSIDSNISIKSEPEDDLEDKIPYIKKNFKPKPAKVEDDEASIDKENSEPPKPTTLSITDFDLCIFCQNKNENKMVDMTEDYLGDIQTLVLNVDCDASQRLKHYICDPELFFNNLPQHHSRCLGNLRGRLRKIRSKKKDLEETDSSLCVFCQEHRMEPLYNMTSKGIETLQNDLNKYDDERIEKLDDYFNFDRIKNLIKVESAKIQEVNSSEEITSDPYKMHKKCRMKFIIKNRPRKLGRPRKNEQENTEANVENSADEDIYELLAQREKKIEEEKLKKQRKILPEPEEFSFKKKCVFCGASNNVKNGKYVKTIKDDKVQRFIDNAEKNQDLDIKKILEYAVKFGVKLQSHEKCHNYYYYGKPQRVKKGTREHYDTSFKAIISEIEDPMFKDGKVFSLQELREKFLSNLTEFEIESDMKVCTFANKIKNYYTFNNKCKVIVIPHPDNFVYSKYASDSQTAPQIDELTKSRSNDSLNEDTDDLAAAKITINFDGNKKWRYACNKCKFKCYGKNTYEKHIKKHERFKCSKCDYRCFKKGSLKEHMKEHKLTIEEIEMAKIMCDTCGLMLRNEQSLKNHMRKHSGEKFYCLQCDKSFFNKHSLESHALTHTGEKNEECPHCGKRFMLKKYVKGHIKKVHEPKPSNWHHRPYLCTECGKNFRTKERLKEHSRKHSDERPFLCNECGASFKYRAPWRTHMLAHEGKKPQMCSICNYGCYTKANLELHMAKHSGINEQLVNSKAEKNNEKKVLEKYNHLYEVPNIKPQVFFPQYRQGASAILWDSHEDNKPLMHFD